MRTYPLLMLSLALFAVTACGEDDAADTSSTTPNPETMQPAPEMNEADAAIADPTNQQTSEQTATEECADDVADTPGNECVGAVTCGTELTCTTCCMKGIGEEHACSDDGSCPDDFTPTACDGPEDCSDGEVCCSAPGEATLCTAADACEGGVKQVMCHTADDCELGASCDRGSIFEYWGFCK